jgi:hypothetical protein
MCTIPAGLHPTTSESQPIAFTAPVGAPPPARAEVAPLAPERYKVQFTVGRETYDKLRKVQDLLRHRLPSGDPAAIFDRALTLLLEELEKKKVAATKRPRGTESHTWARHVPAEIKRTVWARDGGQCRFEGPHGRCRETGLLEFHHVVPYAAGGLTTSDNLELRCAAHNRYEAEQFFGPRMPMFVKEEPSQFGQAALRRPALPRPDRVMVGFSALENAQNGAAGLLGAWMTAPDQFPA